MFLELELFEPALLVLTGVMASDDQEVEAWYLEGWCFFLMAEKAQEKVGQFKIATRPGDEIMPQVGHPEGWVNRAEQLANTAKQGEEWRSEA